MKKELETGGENKMFAKAMSSDMETLARKKEDALLEQLNELLSRGLLVIKQGHPILSQANDGGVEMSQMISLELKDQEYIVKLEAKVKRLEKALSEIRDLCWPADKLVGDLRGVD